MQRRRKSKAKPKDIFGQNNVDSDVEPKTRSRRSNPVKTQQGKTNLDTLISDATFECKCGRQIYLPYVYDCRNVAFDKVTYKQEVVGWVVTGIKENPDLPLGEAPEFILKDPRMMMRRIDRGFFLVLLDTDGNEYIIRDCDPLP